MKCHTRLALVFFVAAVALCSEPVRADCVTCPDKQQTCCNDTQCCSDGAGSYMCCDNDNVCCKDMCCGKNESCCNGTCCITQTSFCCPAVDKHPDRCCPRYTVCCNAEWSGCCEPAWLKAMRTAAGDALAPPTQSPKPDANEGAKAGLGADSVLHTLWVVVSDMHALTIDASSGKVLSSNPVTGYDNWGESTRSFPFDTKRQVFYNLEANFTMPVGKGDPKRPITLYSIDPATGHAKSSLLSGDARNFPSGFVVHSQSGKIVMATFAYNSSANEDAHSGYNFWEVDPLTASSKHLSSCSVAGDFQYAGYFSAIDDSGRKLYRLGYRNVYSELEPGLLITDISQSAATTNWTDLTAPADHGFYISLTRFGSKFVSLAPRTKGGELDLFTWSLSDPSNPTILKLRNAFKPRLFGFLAEAQDASGDFAAAALHNGATPILQRWEIVLFNPASGKSQVLEIQPRLVGETDSISGIGFGNATEFLAKLS